MKTLTSNVLNKQLETAED